MRVNLHHLDIEALLHGPQGPVVREVVSRSRTVSNLAKRKVGVDSGRLRGSIRFTLQVEHGRVVGTIGTMVQYGIYHHEGTGIYGPKKKPITPKSAKMLAFSPKGSGGKVVYAKSVKGSKPNPYLIEALREAVPWPIRVNHLAT